MQHSWIRGGLLQEGAHHRPDGKIRIDLLLWNSQPAEMAEGVNKNSLLLLGRDRGKASLRLLGFCCHSSRVSEHVQGVFLPLNCLITTMSHIYAPLEVIGCQVTGKPSGK